MKKAAWVSDLKLRVGYGVTGNQDFENYKTFTMKVRDDIRSQIIYK